jgi:ABC-type amino acid transport substrate-binding protein
MLATSAAAQDEAGEPLKVGVYLSPPYGARAADSSFSGRSVALWQRVAQVRGWRYDLVAIDSIETLIEQLERRELDVAIGALTITPERERRVDFSHPTHPSGVAVALPIETGFSQALRVTGSVLIDLGPLILTLIAIVTVLGFLIWRGEGGRAKAGAEEDDSIRSIAEGVYWASVTMTTVGYGDKAPKTGAGRALAVAWMFSSIVLTAMFTATIIAKLTASTIAPAAGASSALSGKRLGAVRGASGAEFLSEQGLPFRTFPTLKAALDALSAGDIERVLNSQGSLAYAVSQDYAATLHVAPRILTRTHMAFALPDDSDLKEALDQALLTVERADPAGDAVASSR